MQSTTASQSPRGIPSPYGRACTSCAHAKCRCIYQSDGSGCQRCHRLKKDCVPSVSVRKRNVDVPSVPRRRRLEDRLEDLVTILWEQANNNGQDPRPQAAAPPAVDRVRAPVTPLDSAPPTLPPSDSDQNNTDIGISPRGFVIDVETGMAGFVPQGSGTWTSDVTASQIADSISTLNIAENVADEQLRNFRTAFLPNFGVVHIPIAMNSTALRRERPFLWLVIMSITTRSLATQTKLGDAIRKIVAQQIMMDGERTLDLLLGLLCFIAWSFYHKNERTPMVIWTQLAASLASDLDIHREVPGSDAQLLTRQMARRPGRTLADRRAFLATYLATSLTWLMYGKMEPIRRSPYLDSCMRILLSEKETEMDVLLVTHVKCHLVMDQTTMCISGRADAGATWEGVPSHFVRALEGQLQDIRASLPLETLQKKAISLCLARTEVVVRSALIHTRSNGEFPDLARLQNLDSIVTSIQRWLYHYHEVPIYELMGMTTGSLTQLGHCIMVLFRLTTLREPGWDTDALKRRLNCLEVIDNAARKMEGLGSELCSATGSTLEEGTAVLKVGALMKALKGVLKSELDNIEGHAGGGEPSADDAMMYEPWLSLDVAMDFAMEPWLDDMLGNSV